LTAVRASGVSLSSLVTPVLLLSLVLCGVCALFNLWIAPQCRNAYKNLIYQYAARTASTLITEDRFIDEIPGMILYIRKKDGDNLEDVRLYTLKTNEITQRISAEAGKIMLDEENKTIAFALTNVMIEFRLEADPEFEENLIGPPAPEKAPSWQLAQMGGWATDAVDLTELARRPRNPRLSEMTLPELFHEKQRRTEQGVSPMPVRVQIHRQLSFSFACFAFTLVAIPLAIQAHRRETSIGIAIALGLVMVYYAFLIVGDALETKEHLHPHLILWIPNFLFQAIGGVLLYRANRG